MVEDWLVTVPETVAAIKPTDEDARRLFRRHALDVSQKVARVLTRSWDTKIRVQSGNGLLISCAGDQTTFEHSFKLLVTRAYLGGAFEMRRRIATLRFIQSGSVQDFAQASVPFTRITVRGSARYVREVRLPDVQRDADLIDSIGRVVVGLRQEGKLSQAAALRAT